MSQPIVQIERLSKCYRIGSERPAYLSLREELSRLWSRMKDRSKEPSTRDFWALRDVTWSVQRGDAVGVIGRNGAGKSTLLKILSQITPPTAGRIALRGRVASLLEVGTGFHPELTGRENIFLNGAVLGMRRAEIRRKFDAIVAFADVSAFLDTPVKRYSSGMSVRLAFAVAAHLEPEILLVDEVLAVGDAEFQRKCLGRMSEVAKSGRTVVFVSHNMAAVRELCDEALVLEHGRVQFCGTAEQAVDTYMTRSSLRGGSIAAHITHVSARLAVHRIAISGREDDSIEISGRRRDLAVDVSGVCKDECVVTIEGALVAADGTVIGTFRPGHYEESTINLPPGPFAIRVSIVLPRLLRGDYFLHLYVTNPGIEGLVDVPFAVRLSAEGWPLRSTGAALQRNTENGFIVLPARVELRRAEIALSGLLSNEAHLGLEDPQ
jgi:lipopolysaccharide transport system ATP-binding protein